MGWGGGRQAGTQKRVTSGLLQNTATVKTERQAGASVYDLAVSQEVGSTVSGGGGGGSKNN